MYKQRYDLTVTNKYSEHWLIRPKYTKIFGLIRLGVKFRVAFFTKGINGVCPVEMVKLSGLVE